MAVRSRAFFLQRLVGPGATTTLYVVVSGRTAVVRSAFIRNTGNVAAVAALATLSSSVPFWSGSVPAGGLVVVPYFVLNPDTHLTGSNQAVAGQMVFSAFGSLLLGDPE